MNIQTDQDIAVSHDAAHLDMQVLDAIDALVLDRRMTRQDAMKHQRDVLARTLEMLDGRIARTNLRGKL